MGGWISSRSGWLLELLTELIKNIVKTQLFILRTIGYCQLAILLAWVIILILKNEIYFIFLQVLSLGLSSPALLLHGLLQAPVPEDENQVALFSPCFCLFVFFLHFFLLSIRLCGLLQAPVPGDENQVVWFCCLVFVFLDLFRCASIS